MTESEIRDQLNLALSAQEPPLRADVHAVRTAGVRRRRRRTTGVVAAAVVLVASAALAPGLLRGDEHARDRPPTATTSIPSTPSTPAELATRLEQLAAETGDWESVRVVAEDAQGFAIDGADRQFASRWKATYTSPDHVVTIIVTHQSDIPVTGTDTSCTAPLEFYGATSCKVSTSGAGVVRLLERPSAYDGGSWIIPSKPPGAWTIRQATSFRDDVLSVSVTEGVRRAVDAVLSDDTLTAIALDPVLDFTDRSDDESGGPCGWIVPEQRDNYSCS